MKSVEIVYFRLMDEISSEKNVVLPKNQTDKSNFSMFIPNFSILI